MRRLALLLTTLAALGAGAQAPFKLGYQGRLLRSDGTPAAGVVTMTFTIYDTEAQGSALWSETQQVPLTEGFYATHLGQVTALSPSIFDGAERFLELSVSGETLAPRQRIASVAYALRSVDALNLRGGTVEASSLKVAGSTLLDGPGLASCAGGHVLKWNGTRWSCSADLVGGQGSTYVAGTGLVLNGNTFSLLDTCANNQVLKWSQPSRGWVCAADADSQGTVTQVAATSPLTSSGTTSVTLSLPAASSTASGYLSAASFTAFNAKLSSVVSDATLSGNGTSASPLQVSGTNPAFVWAQTSSAQSGGLRLSGGGHFGGTVTVGNSTTTAQATLDVNGICAITSGGAVKHLRLSTEPAFFSRIQTNPTSVNTILSTDTANYHPLVINHDNGQSTLLNRWRGVVAVGADPNFSYKLVVGGQSRFFNDLQVDGKLGVGTTAPNAKLGVVGNIAASGTVLGGVASPDVAENITAAEPHIEAADVVAAHPEGGERVVRSRTPYQTTVLGVISTRPGILTNAQEADVFAGRPRDPSQRPLALAGRVPVKVTREGGPISPGDLLTSSSTAGHAMRAGEPWRGGIIGTALTAFDGKAKAAGKVIVFLNPQPAPVDGAVAEELQALRRAVEALREENARLRSEQGRLDELERRLATLEARSPHATTAARALQRP